MKSAIQNIEEMLGIERCKGCNKEICECAQYSRTLTMEELRRNLHYKKALSEEKKRENRTYVKQFQNKLKSQFKNRR